MSVNTINNTQGEKNSKCNLCDGNPEVLGWYLDAMCRGVTVMGSAIFMSVAILGLAKEAAGCESEDEICDGRVYGMKPTSVITNIMVAAGLAAATCMPFFRSNNRPHELPKGCWQDFCRDFDAARFYANIYIRKKLVFYDGFAGFCCL